MSGLNSQQRREMYTMVSDDSLAGMLVVMRFPERLKMLREVEQVDQALVDRVLRYIRYTLLLLHCSTKGPHRNGHASCPCVDAAVMPVTSHNTCVYPRRHIVCLAETLKTLLGLLFARPYLRVADDTSWLTPSRSHSLYASHLKALLTLAAGYDQLLQASGWQPCLLRKPFQKLSR